MPRVDYMQERPDRQKKRFNIPQFKWKNDDPYPVGSLGPFLFYLSGYAPSRSKSHWTKNVTY